MVKMSCLPSGKHYHDEWNPGSAEKFEKGAKLASVPFFASGFMLEFCFLKVER